MVTGRSRKRIQITARDLDILAHVLRFRMTVPEAVQRLICPELRDEGVNSILRRLREGGYLDTGPLHGKRYYYYLTPRGATRVGHLDGLSRPEKAGGPLDGQALTRAYAVMSFCCLGEVTRTYLTRHEFMTRFATYDTPGLPKMPYYLHEEDGRTCLGFLLIDYGRYYKRPAIKYTDAVVRRLQMESFRRLIEKKQFIITILVPEDEDGGRRRVELIEAELNKRERLVPFRFATVPHFHELLAMKKSPKHAANR